MNPRIAELLAQATDYADATYKYDLSRGYQIQEWDAIRTSQFAHLILEECLRLCKTAVGNGDYNRGRLDCHDNIREVFDL